MFAPWSVHSGPLINIVTVAHQPAVIGPSVLSCLDISYHITNQLTNAFEAEGSGLEAGGSRL